YTFGADFLSVEPGIQYSQKGYTSEEAGSGLAVKEQLGYIDVPVLVRLKLLPALNVFAGPQASVLASSKYQKGDQTSDSSEATKGYDIGGVFGAQV
ncbi:PorT family protein, partial [Algoriphagus aestuarii]|nr:PorT family protein [Algoriphagus aestuarii]